MTRPPPYQRLSAAKANKMIADQGLTLARVQSRPNVKLYVDSLGRETVLHRFICSTYYFRDWPAATQPTNERVPFRLLIAPCCNTMLCWVNYRLPSYCPECGTHIYPAIRSAVHVFDENATLRYDKSKTP